MFVQHKQVTVYPKTGRTRRLRGTVPLAALFFMVMGLLMASSSIAFALPPEPIEPDPIGGPDPVTVPVNGFDWSMPARFGTYANGMMDFHWNANSATYYQDYVNPTSYAVDFDGCRTEDDEISGTSVMTYTWTLKGETRVNHTCRFRESFFPQGAYTVSVAINNPDGSPVLDPDGKGNPFTQSVLVKDILIVSLGDSYASGEGNPDVPQQVDDFGFVTANARWQDNRCHRSATSGPAQAALALEAADRHSSVTFLSFACSGATISTEYFKDAPALDPYAYGDYHKSQGTGILGPYAGAVPPDENNPQNNQLPSQINQMITALTNGGQIARPSARRVDALLLSGGGNDIGFGNIASVCILYYECPTHFVSGAYGEGPRQFKYRFMQDLQALPARYAALSTALTDTQLNIAKVYVTQYPDSTRNNAGGYCDKILDDVIPGWMQPLLALVAAFEFQPVPLVPYQIDRGNYGDADEIAWAGGTVLPGLNGAVAAAAAAYNWTLVDGIADATANLFSGHGYCASDNWIRRASEATYMQGPWDLPINCNGISMTFTYPMFLINCAPPATSKTKGTLHPTSRGLQAVAERIVAKVAPNVLPAPPPAGAPTPPSFASNSVDSVVGSNGWLIGQASGVSCPAGGSTCAFAQEVASVDPSMTIRGVSLSINGATRTCPTAGNTLGGVKCVGQLANPQTFNWSFTFFNDGIYRLEFTVQARNGAVSKFAREVKVDLHDPTSTSTASLPTPSSGWYQTPVTLTLNISDGMGSGAQNVQYQLDGAALTTVGGNAIQLPLLSDGVHTLTYHATDFAGRNSSAQSLTVNIDQTKPQSSATFAPVPNGAGWNKDNVLVTLSTTDNGGSGIQSYTYSATGAQTIASTTVTGDAPTPLTFSAEGVITLTFGATDIAGNVEANQSVRIQLDKTAPAINIITPTNTVTYTLNQIVPASYNCADSGSGILTCSGTAANGGNIDTTSPGSKTFAVNASDKAGNTSSQSVGYKVAYNICVLYDQGKAHKLGSTVPIKLQLCDATGANASTASILPVMTGLTQTDNTASSDVTDTGNANPDSAFRYDATLNGYIFNLSTKGLKTGTWKLNFTIPGDPVSHSVQFDVR